MGLLLLILVVLLLGGALPKYGYSRSWGYRPSGLLGLVLVVVLVLVLLGSIPFGFSRRVYVVEQPRPVVIDRRPVTVVNPAPAPASQPALPSP
jgi:hypothetical protein